MAAFREAASRGAGVIALDGRMIDAPVVARAEKILALAEAAGCLPGER
jgi:citrate lyase subunit beta/citryl-CoA lyase